MTAKYFHYSMELEPEQPVFMKEVYGNVWKTGVINQPAKEPESYWIKFPDNSILRRTRSMIKPRSQPSYFKLEVEGKEWSSTGIIPPHSHQPFNSMLPALELPALPMDNLVPPASTSKATVCTGKHSSQFHQCGPSFHQQWSGSDTKHS